MATSLVTFQSFGISASSTSSSGSSPTKKASSLGRKSSQSSTGWLTPIFGWSADQPDYIDSSNNGRGSSSSSSSSEGRDAENGEERKKARLRYPPGSFTEEKAKQLRMMTTGLEMSHEKMYHSAIASRLASDFSDRFFDDLS